MAGQFFAGKPKFWPQKEVLIVGIPYKIVGMLWGLQDSREWMSLG
ncbi:hypothetical protein HanRHA438_Chr01g0029371 [Helianthus annuus]|nr:hypothetical protein HanRHA438_Chr01g0029371 [Helianthus annuus]